LPKSSDNQLVIEKEDNDKPLQVDQDNEEKLLTKRKSTVIEKRVKNNVSAPIGFSGVEMANIKKEVALDLEERFKIMFKHFLETNKI
jgi:hypothetical protein